MIPSGDDESGADLVDEVFERALEVEPEALVQKPFQPWHRPRKQFIRQRQWCDELKQLLTDIAKHRAGAMPERIAYLTLPGDELLDVRVLHEVCRDRNVRLRYLGFNTPRDQGRKKESWLSQSEVQKLGHIDGSGSRVLHDRLELLSNNKSLANDAIHRDAPFDVINLDFCDSVGGAPPKTEGSTLEAITRILEVQRSLRTLPWLLFVTTRVDRERLDPQVWEILLRVVAGNIQTSDEFAAALKKVPLDDDPTKWKDDPASLHRAFIIGFGKWLLGLVTSAAPHWRVVLVSSYGYQVQAPMDLLSLSFRFELVVNPMQDASGLVETPVPAPSEEPQLATKLAEEAARCMDVDRELERDAQLMDDMVSQTAELLGSVRYSPEDYRAWLARDTAAVADGSVSAKAPTAC